jgi:hypothetical protein
VLMSCRMKPLPLMTNPFKTVGELLNYGGEDARRRRKINNYFKSSDGTCWFFNERDGESVAAAYTLALASGRKRFAVYRAFPLAGAWYGMDVIGFCPFIDVEGEGSAEVQRRLETLKVWNATRVYKVV